MDGTLLDLNFDRHVWNGLLPQRFAELRGITLEEALEEVSRRLDGVRGTLQWYCLDHWQERIGIDISALETELIHLVKPRSGAIEFLRRLANAPQRVILATNAHPRSMQRKFELTGIDHYFDVIRSSHEYGACKEAQGFWQAFAADLGLDPERTLFVDDNHTVLGAARNFGIAHTYGILSPDSCGGALPSEEFECIGNFDELFGGGRFAGTPSR